MGPVARALISWHANHGRHELPWQHERTPYRVWISEIMLQQTQVSTVIGYYQRFMQRFPDVAALAAAPLDEVLHLWSGLGYYSRARNLQRAAQRIVAEFDGQLPDEREQLAQLPGIGRSTAAAVLALASGRCETILDGNVKRLLARYFGIDGAPGRSATMRELWRRAEECTPATQVAVYTQAIMDFGATVCTRRRPSCPQCPLQADCVAFREQRVQQLPTARSRPARRTHSVFMLLAARADGSVLLRRRPEHGVWGGLWAPPEFDSLAAAALFCGNTLGRGELEPIPLPLVRHAFTHFDLHITPVRAHCAGLQTVMEGAEVLWYNPREPARIGVPAPILALLSNSGISIL
ncbi:MAG TPA: A/G-specific adenine glycosylase [Steroidobacteraceae bacterium]|jgi:A/G-specific adenine glycosylase